VLRPGGEEYVDNEKFEFASGAVVAAVAVRSSVAVPACVLACVCAER
jgi:hypothetical protein